METQERKDLLDAVEVRLHYYRRCVISGSPLMQQDALQLDALDKLLRLSTRVESERIGLEFTKMCCKNPPQPLACVIHNLAGAAVALQPPARGAAVQRTLFELADRPEVEGVMVQASWVRDLFERLSEAREGDALHVTARRDTCGELAALVRIEAGLMPGGNREPVRVEAAAILRAAAALPGDDARAEAVRRTARRELVELGFWTEGEAAAATFGPRPSDVPASQ